MHVLEPLACILQWERIRSSPVVRRQELGNRGLAAVLSAALGDVVVFHSHAHLQAEIGDQQWKNLRSLCVRMEHVVRVQRGKGLEDELVAMK